MKTAVLSGKGGAGKTLIAVNLALTKENSSYVDCDVEEPDGNLFFKCEATEKISSFNLIPEFDRNLCTGCRKCVDACRFNALVFIKNSPVVFPEVCHSCGLCSLICGNNAVREVKRETGIIEKGFYKDTEIITGVLNIGEASGTGVIRDAIKEADSSRSIVIDCPPGSACSVSESISDADLCIIAAEPTAFGFHNFRMVYELTRVMNKKCGVVINKETSPYKELEGFIRENNIPLLGRIPYSKEAAELISEGKILSEEREDFRRLFSDIWKKAEVLL